MVRTDTVCYNWELDELALCQIGPLQIGPLKIRPWTNRTTVENRSNENLFIDLQRAFDWVDKDISSGLLKQKNKGSFSTETTWLN